MQGILHLIPTQTLSILCSLSPEPGVQWHLPRQSDTFEWSWIIEFARLFVTRCWGSSFRSPKLQMFWKRKDIPIPLHRPPPPPHHHQKKETGMVKICFGDFGLWEATHGLASPSVWTSVCEESQASQTLHLPSSSSCLPSRGSGQLPKSNMRTHILRLVL